LKIPTYLLALLAAALLADAKASEENNIYIGTGPAKTGSPTTSNNNAVKQATSFNVLTGKNTSDSQLSRFDIAFVAGLREKSKDCPASYLGYQCYANSAPNTTREFNYGGLLSWSYQKLMVGARATGESNQLLIGIRF
jgi:hypothetical protein